MELWVIATIAAAAFQAVRFMLHKVLSTGPLTTAGSTFARFAYALPFAVSLALSYPALTFGHWPHLTPAFWGFAAFGGAAQILATACVVALFRQRNFAVGITFKKTEVVQTAIVAFVLFGEQVSAGGWLAIAVGLAGVLILSDAPQSEGAWRHRVLNRAAGLGILSGLLFAFSAVGYRGASLQIDSADPLLRSSVTLGCVVVMQMVAMLLWLRWREPGQITRVWEARRTAIWLGLMSMLGSLGWFTAFTLKNAAYVKALGQIELIFSILAATLFFKETITRREVLGMALLSLSVLVLVLVGTGP